jgi:nucleotide-binding universal stress UspA family protein
MTAVLLTLVTLLVLCVFALTLRLRGSGRRRPAPARGADAGRILFPFEASALSRRALDAALRLARAEEATLLPVFLARVPLSLPLDSPLPRQAAIAIPLQEAIEQRAAAFGVPVDARVERGRTYRHALRQTIAHERYDRIVIAAAANDGPGFGPDDVAWLLAHASGEIVVLRPGAEDQLLPPGPPRIRRRRRAEGATRAHRRAPGGGGGERRAAVGS